MAAKSPANLRCMSTWLARYRSICRRLSWLRQLPVLPRPVARLLKASSACWMTKVETHSGSGKEFQQHSSNASKKP